MVKPKTRTVQTKQLSKFLFTLATPILGAIERRRIPPTSFPRIFVRATWADDAARQRVSKKTLNPNSFFNLGGWGGSISRAGARVNGEGGVKGVWRAPREKFTRASPLQTLNPKPSSSSLNRSYISLRCILQLLRTRHFGGLDPGTLELRGLDPGTLELRGLDPGTLELGGLDPGIGAWALEPWSLELGLENLGAWGLGPWNLGAWGLGPGNWGLGSGNLGAWGLGPWNLGGLDPGTLELGGFSLGRDLP